jgi:hypothetical protein
MLTFRILATDSSGESGPRRFCRNLMRTISDLAEAGALG